LGTRGHEPYQLRGLWTYQAVRNEIPCVASVDLRSPARRYNGTHACLDPCPGVGVPLPLPPALGVGGLPSPAAEAGGWGDLDEDCDGIADGGGVGVGAGGEVFDPAAGLGLTRLREPIAQIERGDGRVSVGWTVQGVCVLGVGSGWCLRGGWCWCCCWVVALLMCCLLAWRRWVRCPVGAVRAVGCS
jgi:hypothetical protein